MDARVEKVTSASLADAMAKRHAHPAHILDLTTPTPGRVLWGQAATMLFAPLRDDHKAAHTYDRHLADALGPEGDGRHGRVVVMACGARSEAAVVGGVRVAAFDRWGVTGLLTDGRVRDFDAIGQRRFALSCRGRTPRAGSREAMPVAADIPVPLGGATVVPGDWVYADADGAVVVPAADVDAVLDAAVAVEAADAQRERRAGDGAAHPTRKSANAS